ncbi:hypothetical protein KDAU_53960 [Dictyobacter aurantiacus]|uniref:Uncharacterized protein n=1 Tax=Dictyobacter aurantiacus TaxID=1936993 RepID=A0A401ZMG0_9CHLR|nr:hypothetical protein KDAU_53960 [Dictyobacter aurantiacus]
MTGKKSAHLPYHAASLHAAIAKLVDGNQHTCSHDQSKWMIDGYKYTQAIVITTGGVLKNCPKS